MGMFSSWSAPMATLPENADTHYREALECLNQVHGQRLDMLDPEYRQEAFEIERPR